MTKNNEPWYWNNLNAAVALALIVAMIALCSLLAPGRSKKATVYQNGNLTIQCIEKKAGACDQVKIRIQNKEAGNETGQ
jgi:hypothetical protein